MPITTAEILTRLAYELAGRLPMWEVDRVFNNVAHDLATGDRPIPLHVLPWAEGATAQLRLHAPEVVAAIEALADPPEPVVTPGILLAPGNLQPMLTATNAAVMVSQHENEDGYVSIVIEQRGERVRLRIENTNEGKAPSVTVTRE